MTLLELAVAMPVLLLALAMLSQIVLAGRATQRTGAEMWSASSGAGDTLEQMHNADFRDLFRLYNADPFDDPDGPGTAPGPNFAVAGLDPLESDPDGLVGEVILPFVNVGSEVAPEWQVLETADLPELGLPRDLTGDVILDSTDHSTDYAFLPCIVELRWQGRFGPREYRVVTLFSELR